MSKIARVVLAGARICAARQLVCIVIVVVLLGCVTGLWWMFSSGHLPPGWLVDKGNVIGGGSW